MPKNETTLPMCSFVLATDLLHLISNTGKLSRRRNCLSCMQIKHAGSLVFIGDWVSLSLRGGSWVSNHGHLVVKGGGVNLHCRPRWNKSLTHAAGANRALVAHAGHSSRFMMLGQQPNLGQRHSRCEQNAFSCKPDGQ